MIYCRLEIAFVPLFDPLSRSTVAAPNLDKSSHQVVKSSGVLYGAAQGRVWSQKRFQCCSLSSLSMILLGAPTMYMTIGHRTPVTRRGRQSSGVAKIKLLVQAINRYIYPQRPAADTQ
jgi:hypothetical protein